MRLGFTVRSARFSILRIHSVRRSSPRSSPTPRSNALPGSFFGELRASNRPNLLVAEDLHWADQATLDLLRFLARRLDGTRTLLIATFRDDSLEPDHELRLLLGDLVNQPNVARFSLPPLSFEAVAQMAAASPIDPRALFDLTGGNPYFVAEILNSKRVEIPHSIRDVVLARTARLDPDSRRVLEYAAVAGPALDPRLMRLLHGHEVATEIERCMHVGLLRSTRDGVVFRHALTRDVLLGEMSAIRRAEIARRILAELVSHQGRSPNLPLLAHFAEEAIDPDAVMRYAIPAAADAARLGAHRQAVLQYDRALRFSEHISDADTADLLEARSFELHVTSLNDRAITDISQAIDLRRLLGDVARLGNDLRLRSRYLWIAGRNAEAETDALSALETLVTLGTSVELAMAYSNLAQLRMLSGRAPEAIELGNQAIDLATELDAPEVRLHAMTNVGTALVGKGEDGWVLLEQAAAIAGQLGLHDDVARTYTNRAFSALDQHQLRRAAACAREGIVYTDEHDVVSMKHYLHAVLATAQMEAGERTSPEQELSRLLNLPHIGIPTRILASTSLGLLRARQGEDARDLLDEALDIARRTGEFQRIGPVLAARAEAGWLANDLETTLREAQAGLELSTMSGNQWSNGRLGLWLCRAGGTIAPDLALAEPYRMEIAGAFDAAAVAWKQLGYPIQHARALAASREVDRLREALEIFLKFDARPDALRVTKELRRQGQTHIPKGPIDRTRDNPAHLTDRELEVLHYLGLGKSNREIAELLFISPRTCGHHVSAIFSKLDVHSRREAVSRAAELGLK